MGVCQVGAAPARTRSRFPIRPRSPGSVVNTPDPEFQLLGSALQRLADTERDCYLSVMENNGEPTLRPSPEEARTSLEDVRRMEADLADRLVTPWWYYPGMGLVEALIVSSLAFPASLSAPALVAGVAGLGLLVSAYRRLTGLGVSSQYFALARAWSIALLVVC